METDQAETRTASPGALKDSAAVFNQSASAGSAQSWSAGTSVQSAGWAMLKPYRLDYRSSMSSGQGAMSMVTGWAKRAWSTASARRDRPARSARG